jgi:predicted acyl esterase
MYGFSYVGATQLQAALERPSSLVTICPDLTASQYYDGWTYNGGAFALAFNISWATYLAADDARRRGDDTATQTLNAAFLGAPNFYSQLPLGEYAPLASSAYGGYGKDWIPVPRLNREMTGVLATARFETSSV